MKYSWTFRCIDNGRKHQSIKIKAADKSAAINEGFKRANKKAKGDIISWECTLDPIF